MRGDVGRHANGNAGSPVNQKVWDSRRQNPRLSERAVEIVSEIDGFLVDVSQHFFGDWREPRLGVSHCCWRVVVNAAEVSLAVDQRHPQAERLGHSDHCVIDSRVTVGMPFA